MIKTMLASRPCEQKIGSVNVLITAMPSTAATAASAFAATAAAASCPGQNREESAVFFPVLALDRTADSLRPPASESSERKRLGPAHE